MSASGRGIPGVVNTIAGMLDEFDEWKQVTDMPTKEGVSIDYSVKYIYIGPDGIARGTSRDEITAPGPDGHGPPPGRYEVHIVDSNGKDLTDPFRAEHITYEMMARRRPEDSYGSAISAAMGDLESQIRNQRVRIDAAEKREERYRLERNTALDNNAKLMRDKAMLELQTQTALGDAQAAKEEATILREELAQLREETALFKPHAQMLVSEGMQWISQALGFPTPANMLPVASGANRDTTAAAGDPMPVGIGAEDPLALFNKFFAATLMSPYFCKYIVDNGHMFMPPLAWSDIRGLIWANTRRDPGVSPNWEQMFADYEAEMSAAAE